MSLIDDIRKEMFETSKSGNDDVSQILKMVLASIKNEEINLGKELSDEEVIKILRKEIKKIEDSISEYTKINRNDLLEKEKIQLESLSKYVPAMMDISKVREIVSSKISELGVKDMRDMGRVMGVVMKELNGQADGNQVREIVSEILSKNE